MATILLREDDITKNTPVGGSVEMSRLIPAIKQAQITAIKPLLGDALYNKLTEDFKEGNLEKIYLELYDDYVKPMLIHLSTSYFFTYGAYQIGNKGIYKATGSDTEGLSKNEVDYISKAQYSYYESYKSEFFNFIDVNAKYITEYSKSETSSTKRKKFGGWSFGVNGNAPSTGGNASSAIKNEIEVLKETVSILEGTVGDNGNTITLIQDNIEVLEESLSILEGNIGDNVNAITINQNEIDELELAVTEIENTKSSLNQPIFNGEVGIIGDLHFKNKGDKIFGGNSRSNFIEMYDSQTGGINLRTLNGTSPVNIEGGLNITGQFITDSSIGLDSGKAFKGASNSSFMPYDGSSGNMVLTPSTVGYFGKIRFNYGPDSLEGFRLTHLGDVGIGTTSPSTKLDVVGTIKGTEVVDNNGNTLSQKIDSKTINEPNGSDVVANIVSLTQAEYDAGSVNPDTFYIITD